MNQELVIPTHLGIILDGNRRWAKEHGLSSLEGHREGYSHLKDIAKYAFDKGVKYVSAYVFSMENWSRTKAEVKYLMSLALRLLTIDIDELNRENIKVLWLGSRERLSQKLLKAIANAEERTKNNTHGTLCLCFNYGGQQEIADAVKSIVSRNISLDKITPELIEDSLYGNAVPPIDLLVRTSGEHRLSGFMLYRSAYAELYFVNKQWPDFSNSDLDDAIVDFSTRSRRFGK